MVKPKQRNNRYSPSKKHQNQNSLKVNPPNEEDWIFIKKQRVSIIIPPLPNKMHSTIPSSGDGQLQENPSNRNNSQSPDRSNPQLQHPSPISAPNQPVEEQDKSMPSREPCIQLPIVGPPSEPAPNLHKPSSLSHRICSDHSPLSRREGKGIGVRSTLRGGRRTAIFVDGGVCLNRRMRASYLETKLKKAGGLENWLVSLGLNHFVKIFRMRNVNKFQMANLTMQKLKEMGTDAVGPRRKLMHAIDCLCEPHCFQRV